MAGWLVVLLCCALTAGWGGFAWYGTGEHQRVLPAGQAWTQPDGSSLQIRQWHELKQIDDSNGKPVAAPEGASWVQVLEDSRDVGPETSCGFQLAGPGGLRWEESLQAPYRGTRSSCSDAEGPDQLLEVVFLVADRDLASLRGLAIEHGLELRQPPILARPV